MKLSTIFNNIGRELEVQVAKGIVAIMYENGWNNVILSSEANDWHMCFYPSYKMEKIILNNGIYYVYCKTNEGRIREEELFDHAVIPLPDLLAILEELERQTNEITHEDSN